MKPILFLSLVLCFTASTHGATWIDGIQPGTAFSYGCHALRWIADPNGNHMMDPGEVEVQRNNASEALNEQEFTQIIKRRRAGLYAENRFVYKKTPTRDLEILVDFPKDWNASDRRPAIVWFFGGAWNTGTPFAFAPQGRYFADRGAVCFRVDYRIRTVDGIVTDGFVSGQDAKTAIRWVRKNAARLGVDPDRIMAGGDSAGGHLAVATQIESLNDPDDDLSISTKVSALMLHNPYVVRINEKSWVFQIDFKTLPPVWVAYSTNDKAAYDDDPSTRRTERNGESFVRELGEAGIPLRSYIKNEGGHGFCSGPPHLKPSTAGKDAFLQELGLLPAGSADLPDRLTGGGMLSRHLKAIEAGELEPTTARKLAFVTRASGN